MTSKQDKQKIDLLESIADQLQSHYDRIDRGIAGNQISQLGLSSPTGTIIGDESILDALSAAASGDGPIVYGFLIPISNISYHFKKVAEEAQYNPLNLIGRRNARKILNHYTVEELTDLSTGLETSSEQPLENTVFYWLSKLGGTDQVYDTEKQETFAGVNPDMRKLFDTFTVLERLTEVMERYRPAYDNNS